MQPVGGNVWKARLNLKRKNTVIVKRSLCVQRVLQGALWTNRKGKIDEVPALMKLIIKKTKKKKIQLRTSLVVQWLRIRLPMQGPWVRALVREDPTCCRATKPVHHNYWACALEPVSHNYWACVPQLLSPCATTTEAHVSIAHALQQEKPPQWEAHALQRRAAPARRNKRKPACSNEDPTQPKEKKKKIPQGFKKKKNSVDPWTRVLNAWVHLHPDFFC